MIELTLHVSINKCGVSFTATPEGVTFTAEAMGSFESVLVLGSTVGEDVSRWGSSSTLSVAWVTEQAGCAPEELLASFVLELLKLVNDAVEILVSLSECSTLR